MIKDTSKRLILAVLAAAMVYWATPVGATCGPCFSRCIDACNQIRMVCEEQCALDCAALFPDDPAAFDGCREACNAVCAAYNHDCKIVCQSAKDPIPAGP